LGSASGFSIFPLYHNDDSIVTDHTPALSPSERPRSIRDVGVSMMAGIESHFSSLMRQIREGSETATRELVVDYGSCILRVVRRRLKSTLRSKFDSQDFVQAVWASFFAFQPGRYRFDRPEDLVAFLSEMARNKVVEAVRQRLCSQKYDVNREQPLGESECPAGPPVCRQPAPEEIAIAREEWQRLLQDQPIHYQRILEMVRGGHRRQEVARDLGVSEKTVHRVLRKLQPRPDNNGVN
jgi:RNA polymerase sigma factor (sigma-70 family)